MKHGMINCLIWLSKTHFSCAIKLSKINFSFSLSSFNSFFNYNERWHFQHNIKSLSIWHFMLASTLLSSTSLISSKYFHRNIRKGKLHIKKYRACRVILTYFLITAMVFFVCGKAKHEDENALRRESPYDAFSSSSLEKFPTAITRCPPIGMYFNKHHSDNPEKLFADWSHHIFHFAFANTHEKKVSRTNEERRRSAQISSLCDYHFAMFLFFFSHPCSCW